MRLAKSLSPSWARALHERIRPRPDRRPSWLREHAWRDWRPRATSSRLPSSLHSHVQRQRWASLTDPRHVYSMEVVQHLATRDQVEYRFPFMDADLIAFTLAIPARFWPPPWPYERLHRNVLADLLPSAVQQRRGKANASDALAKRVTCQLPSIRRILASGTWFSEPYVDRAAAAGVVDRFERARSEDFWASWAVWAIMTLEAWLRALSSYTAAR